MVMVKPALPYLDLIRTIKDDTRMPLAAYNVSGEYAMLKAAAAAGYLDERAAVLETLTSIRRAGADIIITYHAKDAARWLTLGVDLRLEHGSLGRALRTRRRADRREASTRLFGRCVRSGATRSSSPPATAAA